MRIVARDHPEQHAAAEAFLHSQTVEPVLIPSTVSEIVFVLTGRHYGYGRHELADAIERLLLLPIEVLDRPEIELAVRLFRDHHDDWDDCLVSAYALRRAGGRVASFDRGIVRIPGVARLDPLLA